MGDSRGSSWDFSRFVFVASVELGCGGYGIAPGAASRAMAAFKACVCVRIGISKREGARTRTKDGAVVFRGHAPNKDNEGQSSITNTCRINRHQSRDPFVEVWHEMDSAHPGACESRRVRHQSRRLSLRTRPHCTFQKLCRR